MLNFIKCFFLQTNYWFFLSCHWFLLFLIKIFLHFWGLLLLSFCLLLKLVDVQSFFFWHVIIQRYKFLKAFFAVLHQFWSSNTLATWCKQLTQRKSPWCWERLKAKGQEGSRGWDGWMASPTQWTWVWASSGSWWRTGKPGVLQSMGS